MKHRTPTLRSLAQLAARRPSLVLGAYRAVCRLPQPGDFRLSNEEHGINGFDGMT